MVRDRTKLKTILRRAGARNARIFGSVARGVAGPKSDLDIVVGEFDPPISILRQLELRDEVSQLVGRDVDLVTERSLHWLTKPQILSEAVAL